MKQFGRFFFLFWGSLTSLGGVLGVVLLIAFAQTGWGAPGTAVYQTYELLNRLMAVALLFMAAGWLVIFRLLTGYGRWAAGLALIGCLTVAFATAAEFWWFTDLPYAGSNLRQAAFSAVSFGGLLLDIGATIVGLAVWRSQILPRWSSVLLLLAMPIDVAAFVLLNSPFTTATLNALTLGWLILTNSQQMMLEFGAVTT